MKSSSAHDTRKSTALSIHSLQLGTQFNTGTSLQYSVNFLAVSASTVSFPSEKRSSSHRSTSRPRPAGAALPSKPLQPQMQPSVPKLNVSPVSTSPYVALATLTALPGSLSALKIQYGSSEPVQSTPLSSTALKLTAL